MGVLTLGKLHPQEVDVPPPSLAPPPNDPWGISGVISKMKAPPLYVYTQRREPPAGPAYVMAPDDQLGARPSSYLVWQEAPDPIRQSPFYTAGNKINPEASMRIVSHTAIGSIEGVDDQRFQIGKLLGYFVTPMYQGKQQPSLIRSNIQEALPSTFGSQYEVTNIQPSSAPVSYAGFSVKPDMSPDGYPY